MPEKRTCKQISDMLYYRHKVKNNRPQGVDQVYKTAIPPFHSPKYQGGFCYVRLLTKRKHKCKQCQDE